MMKKIILLLIQFIEFIQYHNLKRNPDNPLDKFVDIMPVKKQKVKGPNGYINIEDFNVTIPFRHYYLELENGMKLEGANYHIVVDSNNYQKTLSELKTGDEIQTEFGSSKVKIIKKKRCKTSMYDLSLQNDFLYYTNGILSHNTVSAAIYILWFILFQNDKGVMIVANKSATVIEITDKIKSIYKLLPFFLKQGVVIWNQKAITLENGCRIKTDNRTKEPAIGFTIDLLYFDEFAKVPDNIIRIYYGTAVPIISALENSKIIITSTPDGYNLFYELLSGAEKMEGDSEKNEYKPMRVYWYELKGRQDTKIKNRSDKMSKYGIQLQDIEKELEDNKYKIYKRISNNKKVIYVKFELDDEKTHIDEIRKLRIKGVPLLEIAEVTNWQEEETKLIGGESMFRQEFGIEFITGDKLLFDDIDLQRLEAGSATFDFVPFPNLDNKMPIPYENLRWIVDHPDVLNLGELKKYYIFGGIDTGEGLGQDYTVMNLFRLMMKDKNYIIKNRHKFANIYDFFQLKQLSNFRSNIISIKEFAHLFYLVLFELMDPEKCKIALEYNGPGSDLLHYLPNVLEGNNEYSSSIFARYKHTADAILKRPGIKVHGNKLNLVKGYQDAIKKQNIIINDPISIHENKLFTRHDTPSGEYTYKASGGHDDSIMSVIMASTLFETTDYKNLVDNYIATELSETDRKFLEDRISAEEDTIGDYYNVLISSRKRFDTSFNDKNKNIQMGRQIRYYKY